MRNKFIRITIQSMVWIVVMMASVTGFCEVTANDLESYCESTILMDSSRGERYSFDAIQKINNEDGLCRGYLLGFLSVASSSEKISKKLLAQQNICLPDKYYLSQLAKIIVNYLDENPEYLNKSANEVLTSALAEAFPCDASKNAAVNVAISNMADSYEDEREILCEKLPSFQTCKPSCMTFDKNATVLICSWPQGETYRYIKDKKQ